MATPIDAPWLPAHGSSNVAFYRWQRYPGGSRVVDPLGALEIEFRNGAVYQYGGVPESVYDALFDPADGSRGKEVWRSIRGKFPTEKLRSAVR